jgi:hypothetical protein
VGLEKLSEANELVSQMQQELILLGPQIEAKAKVKIENKHVKKTISDKS